MPFCTQCGAKLRDGANFCTKCGKAVRKRNRQKVSPTRATTSPIRRERVNSYFDKEKKTDSSPSILEPIIFREKDFSKPSSEEKDLESEDKVIQKEERSFNETMVSGTQIHDGAFPSSIQEEIVEKQPEETVSEQPKDENFILNSKKELLTNQLQKIKYSFKNIEELEPYKYKTTFLAGSLEYVDWDFSDENTIFVTGLVTNTNYPDLKFSITIPSERPEYDWRNPYAYAKLDTSSIQDDSIIRKIKREGRVIEKLSKIKGKVDVEIDGKKIYLKMVSTPENIKAALDAVKEISWLIDITLR